MTEKALYGISNPNSRSLRQEAMIRFRRNKIAVVSFYVLVLLVVIALATLLIDFFTADAVYREYVIKQNLMNKLQPPSVAHPFGCDEFGRDILFRILWGTRYSFFVGLFSVCISGTLGTMLGTLAGFYGGKVDHMIMRVMDVFLAVPATIMAIAIVAALGTSMFNLLISIALPRVPRFARVVRASVMSVRDQEFIEAARAVGASDARLIFAYILPNVIAPIIVQATLEIAQSILNIATLSFIGLGVQPPVPEWGSILSSARNYMRDAWHITVFPGLAIMMTVLSLNLFGDGLRDAMDPKQKR